MASYPRQNYKRKFDTTKTVELYVSPLRIAARGACCALFTMALAAIFVGVATGRIHPRAPVWVGLLAIGSATLLLLLACAFVVRRALICGPVVILSPLGLHDTRMSHLPIAWPDIRYFAIRRKSLESWAQSITFDINPDAKRRVPLTRIARLLRPGLGLFVSTMDLSTGSDDLLVIMKAYRRDYGNEVKNRPQG
jgi:hypothetical protein